MGEREGRHAAEKGLGLKLLNQAEGLSILRDLVNAEISFKELARQTGLGEKSLHRMLNRNGNPTARNLGVIVKSIAEDLGIKSHVPTARDESDALA